jgi:hypothetical protein
VTVCAQQRRDQSRLLESATKKSITPRGDVCVAHRQPVSEYRTHNRSPVKRLIGILQTRNAVVEIERS